MKEHIEDKNLDAVVGGTVRIGGNNMVVSFTELGISRRLRNCTYNQALLAANDLLDQHHDMTAAEFDQFVYDYFRAQNWCV